LVLSPVLKKKYSVRKKEKKCLALLAAARDLIRKARPIDRKARSFSPREAGRQLREAWKGILCGGQ